ncbi:hypothetical protein KFE25_000822 [Diacronema lutheri]|uniref:Kinesin motor domain-containing protein n=1 Tax=Diacronema lutheri TaxID=2081491 RepID=A0A8J5XR49_DIALT|nr:hypothetical protein KFE25_000822 [Diacronema lutheri]
MDDGPDDRTPSLVPRLAWQPAEAALTGLAEPVAVAAEERRSTMVPQGAHQKDVQWNRIRELTESLQKEREVSASLTTRFHDFQRDAAAQQRQMQQIVEGKESTARAQAAELEAHREAVRAREQQLLDDVARWQARAGAAEEQLTCVRADLAALVAQRAAEEEARVSAAAEAARAKEEQENDEDALEGNERALEMLERSLERAAAAQDGERDGAGGEGAAASTGETVEDMINAGRTGGQIATALVERAMLIGRRAADAAAHDALRRWREERTVRRQLQNSLQELKGSIRVMCRVRPLSDAERAHGSEEVVQPTNDMACTLVDPSKPGARKHFGYDRVFGPSATQADVFDEVQPLVASVFDGYNLCVFAYGQTGSGKTHTMQGAAGDAGIGPRLLAALFSEADERRALAAASAAAARMGAGAGAGVGMVATGGEGDDDVWQFTVNISYLEVYNEHVRDLLAPGAKPAPVDVRQGAANDISIPGLTLVQVDGPAAVDDALRLGASKRAVGATSMNAHSSRSHSLILATIAGRHAGTGATSSGKLYLVDLAGSERVSRSGVSGDRMTEAQNINRSLSALGDVMAALQAKAAHVPFRNSKLTQLLADSLGGKSKAIMFVNVSPAADSAAETACSLNFAARVGNVELGSVKKNGGGGGTALALKLSRDSEDKLRAELFEARERAGAAERRVAEAQSAAAEAEQRATAELEEARSGREGLEFAARAELDRLSTELAQETRQRELAEAAVGKARDGCTAQLASARAELDAARVELARLQAAHAAALSAQAAAVAASRDARQPPSETDKAAAVAALRQQALLARAAAAAGGAGSALASGMPAAPAAMMHPPMRAGVGSAAATEPVAPELAARPTEPTHDDERNAAPASAAAAAAAIAAVAGKNVRFAPPRAQGGSPPSAPTHRPAPAAAAALAAAPPAAQPAAQMTMTPTRAGALLPRAPGGTPRAAAQQMRAMPAVQALYGADALGALTDLRALSDLLPALPPPLVPTAAWEPPRQPAPVAPTVASGGVALAGAAEKENMSNDARSTATGELISFAPAHAPASVHAHAQQPVLHKPALKAAPLTLPIKFAPAPLPPAHAHELEVGAGTKPVAPNHLFGGAPSYLEQTKSSSSRFTGGFSTLGGAQRVVAGKGQGRAVAKPSRESESGGRGGGDRRASLVARQSFAASDGVRRKGEAPGLGGAQLSALHEGADDATLSKRRRF